MWGNDTRLVFGTDAYSLPPHLRRFHLHLRPIYTSLPNPSSSNPSSVAGALILPLVPVCQRCAFCVTLVYIRPTPWTHCPRATLPISPSSARRHSLLLYPPRPLPYAAVVRSVSSIQSHVNYSFSFPSHSVYESDLDYFFLFLLTARTRWTATSDWTGCCWQG